MNAYVICTNLTLDTHHFISRRKILYCTYKEHVIPVLGEYLQDVNEHRLRKLERGQCCSLHM